MSKTETQSDALQLAAKLRTEVGNSIRNYVGLGTAHMAAKELERLDARVKSLEFSFNEWHAKTDWVQETAQALELGMHRADVLRARIEALDAENKALRARLEAPAAPMADEREVFEEWARSQPMILDLTPRGDGYAGAFAQTTWMGWKARGAALAPQAAAKTGDAA